MQNTHSPVDPDLLNDINRLPERQRLTIILNELGVGLAGRGSDLNVVIRRANPALQELDKVLAILAGENHVLAKLAVDSDKALAPLAAVRKQFAEYFAQSNTVAQASARHLERARTQPDPVPAVPAPARPGDGTPRAPSPTQTTPMFTDLGIAAPAINQAFTHLPAFSKQLRRPSSRASARPPRQSGPALVAIQPLLSQLSSLGAAAKPFANNFAAAAHAACATTGGLERIMDFIFLGAGSANGYDALGHFLRTEGLATICLDLRAHPRLRVQRQTVLHGRGSTGSSASASAFEPQHDQPRDGAHAGGPQRRHAGTGAGQIPRLGTAPPAALSGAGGAASSRPGGPAGRRRERRHHLLHARRPKAPAPAGCCSTTCWATERCDDPATAGFCVGCSPAWPRSRWPRPR